MKDKVGPWHAVYFCAKCGQELSQYEVLYSGGICPVCGNKGNNITNAVSTKDRIGRIITSGPWYNRKKYRELLP